MFGVMSWRKLLTELKKIGLYRTAQEFETLVKREEDKSNIEEGVTSKVPHLRQVLIILLMTLI